MRRAGRTNRDGPLSRSREAVLEREFSLAQMRLGYDALYEDLTAVRMPRVMYGAA